MSQGAAVALDQQFAGAGPDSRLAAAWPGKLLDDKILNVRPDPVDFRDSVYRASLVELEARLIPETPASLGLAVRQQGAESSCTGQALAAVIDMQNARRFAEGADVPSSVSARMLYESARAFDEYPGDDLPGSSARGVIKGFFHRGVCSTDLAPYVENESGWRLTVERAKDARRVTLGTYYRLRHILNDYHAALTEARAILCTSMIHGGWQSAAVAQAGGRIAFPQDVRDLALIGAHAFALVGYDTDGFIVLNSWGDDWGGHAPVSRAGDDGTWGPNAKRTQPLLGMALWSYEDWANCVLDAWVLRLQVPTRHASGFAGGYRSARRSNALRDDPMDKSVSAASIPAKDVAGHYINVANGAFVKAPPIR